MNNCGEGIYPRWAAKRPLQFYLKTPYSGFATATQPSGDKSPRHKVQVHRAFVFLNKKKGVVPMKMFGRTLLTLSLMGAMVMGAQANDKVLRVYNWSDYIAPDTVKKFEDETGIRVT